MQLAKKEKPVLISKNTDPRCFRDFDKRQLPVRYYDQQKAWVTGEILNSYLTTFNSKMKAERRCILLFLGNAGCHPQNLQDKHSNIKIVFLPAKKIPGFTGNLLCNTLVRVRFLLIGTSLSKAYIDEQNVRKVHM